MTIEFECPHCGNAMRVKDEAAGKRGQCKNCGETVRVPDNRATAIAARPTPQPEEQFYDEMQRQAAVAKRGSRTLNVPPSLPGSPIQINVQQPSRAAHSLGIASTILGILAFLICWIPLVGAIGIPLSGLGLLLGAIGVILAVARRGTGIGFSIAGSAICSIALLIAFVMTSAIFGGVAATAKAIDDAAEAAKQRVSGPAAPRGANNRDKPARAAIPRPAQAPANGAVPPVTAKKAPKPQESADPWETAGNTASDNVVRVRVLSAKIGKVPLKDFSSDEATSKDDLLMISLEIENLSKSKKLDYRGWAGGRIGFGGSAATLEDDAGNAYKRIGFGISKVVGQQESESLYPSKSLGDVLVFEVPVDAAKTLRLTLPSKTYGGDGDLHIVIPIAAIGK